jgi:hypothetical protein
MPRYLLWGGIFATDLEMIDDMYRHGTIVEVRLFDGGDGYLRGSAEVRPHLETPPETEENP